MRKNPERLAWLVLTAAFFTCVTLAVAVPLGVRAFVLYSRIPQRIALEVQRPPLRVTLGGRGAPVAVAETRSDVPERTTIATDSTSGQLLMSVPRSDSVIVVRVQIYDNTEITLASARTPRYRASRQPNEVELHVARGRVRVGVSPDHERPTVVAVTTPYGSASLGEGSYEIKVTDAAMEVAVRSGSASVSSVQMSRADQALRLGPGERAIVDRTAVTGPLAGARNLIRDGEFQLPFGRDSPWTTYSSQTDPAQPEPRVTASTAQGRTVADFYRTGSNHAEVGIVQEINYDVRDFSYLELHMVVRVNAQDIAGYGGCGYLSSECPIIVALNYKDIYGNDQEWLHGFYTGEPAPGWPLYPWTEEIPPGVWHIYDSGNLIEELATTPPAVLQSLEIYASGHTFHAMTTEIELLAQE